MFFESKYHQAQVSDVMPLVAGVLVINRKRFSAVTSWPNLVPTLYVFQDVNWVWIIFLALTVAVINYVLIINVDSNDLFDGQNWSIFDL